MRDLVDFKVHALMALDDVRLWFRTVVVQVMAFL